MRTADVKAALRERYQKPEWAIFFEVANGAGAHARRYADAIAMNLFPSRGLEINGFEIKVSRSDWLRELKNPEKAESIFKYCDRWWIVASRDSVKPEELPPTWGYIEAKDGKLRQVVQAPKLQPVPIDRAFSAALIRRAGETDNDQIQALVSIETDRIRAQERERVEREIDMRSRKHKEFLDRLEKVKEMTGIDLTKWTPTEEIAAAIKFGLQSNVFSSYSTLRQLKNSAERLVKEIGEAEQIIKPETIQE